MVIVYVDDQGQSWLWSYGSLIYNYMCNLCLSPLKLWVRTRSWRDVLDATLCDNVCQWLTRGRWLSPGTQVSSYNKTDSHVITEILLKVALNTINQPQTTVFYHIHNLHRPINWIYLRPVEGHIVFTLFVSHKYLCWQVFLHLKYESLKTVYACVLLSDDWYIVTIVWV